MNDFAQVPAGGYAWWYFDAVSDDGRTACACIFFIGSVFSPDYAARIRRGERVRAEEHVGVNLAVYERGRPTVWVMSEYGEAALRSVGEGGPRIAGSAIERESGGTVRVTIDERSAPFLVALLGVGRRVRGTLTLEPLGPSLPQVELTQAGDRHRWQAIVPRARFSLRLDEPRLAFDGTGYHDVNAGDARLERAFTSWSWARFHDGERTTIIYGTRARDGKTRGMIADSDGNIRDGALDDGPARAAGWGLSLPTDFRVTAAGAAPLVCTPTELWDVAPFYARYAATLSDGTRSVGGMGEHLDLERFSSPGIQFLLRFKTRRSRT